MVYENKLKALCWSLVKASDELLYQQLLSSNNIDDLPMLQVSHKEHRVKVFRVCIWSSNNADVVHDEQT